MFEYCSCAAPYGAVDEVQKPLTSSSTKIAHFVIVTECHKASLTDGAKDLPWSSGEWLEGFHHETHTPTRAFSPL